MKIDITQCILEKLERRYKYEWKRLLSEPTKDSGHSFMIAIDPSQNLLTNDLDLSDAIIIGTYKTSYACVQMIQNKNMQISHVITEDKDKTSSYIKLRNAIRAIIVDLYFETLISYLTLRVVLSRYSYKQVTLKSSD